MPSPMKQTYTVRHRKAKKRGAWRKNRLENHGTTDSAADLFKLDAATK